MADEFAVKIDGIDEVLRNLSVLPDRMVAQGFSDALGAAGYEIAKEVAVHTPSETKITNIEGGAIIRQASLLPALTTVVVVDSELRGGYAEVGFGKMGFVARYVEYGHRMFTHKPGHKEVGQVPPHPFMRPSLEAAAQRALDAFVLTLSGWFKGKV